MQTSRLCWVALAAMVCAAAGPQEKVELNTITKVDVRGNSIEIVGDRKPNFTTFSMSDPPRLVVDFSEAIFVGVSEELRGNGGLVAGIKTASYGSDASAIARVVIGFNRNVDTDIAIASGTKLVIKALGEGSPQVAEASLGSAREGPKVSPAKKPAVVVAAAVPSTPVQ
ncbi:MAG TPA: AMIN domain-containing protein, partial [Myxococcales bacterium]